jgi:proteasome lid subunit RPN8/RPN11
MTAAAESPDIRQLQGESLPAGDFPVGAKQDYRVFIAPAVHEKIWKHASENVALEICGVLVGTWQRDTVGPFVTITEFIRCDSAKSGFAEVTFTHEAWTKINAEMDTRLSAFKIVGWYHSHPDFGIFLSDRDIFIHQHFFSGAGQIAHVVDPVRKIEGVFAWQAGKPVLRPHFWVGERVFVTPDRPPPEEVARALASDRAPAPAGPIDFRSGWLGTLTTAAMFACVFLLGLLIAGRRTDLARQLDRERDLEGVVEQFVRRGLLRPGLDENLGKVSADLQQVSKEIEGLAGRHRKLAGDDGPMVKEQWDGAHARLTAAEQRVHEMRSFYVLAPDDQAVVKEIERQIAEAIIKNGLQGGARQTGGDKPDSSRKKSARDEKRKSDDNPERGKKKSAPPAAKSDAGSPKSADRHGPPEE